MKIVRAALVLPLLFVQATGYCRDAPSLARDRQVRVREGAIWCTLDWDGKHIVVGTENRKGILLRKYTVALEEAGQEALIASPDDTRNRQPIADHKQIFLVDHHYIVFSGAGAKDSYLVKCDRDLKRAAFVPVVASSDIPTNDMFLTTDGETIFVGHFLPGKGHRIYAFDSDLKAKGAPLSIGDGDLRHSNGAAAIFLENRFTLLAPKTLNPRDPNAIYRLTFDKAWRSVGDRRILIESGNRERMVTGLAWSEEHGIFTVHYMAGKPASDAAMDDSGSIMRQLFTRDWKPIGEPQVVVDKGHRPHTITVKEMLFLGYDSPKGVAVERYKITQ